MTVNVSKQAGGDADLHLGVDPTILTFTPTNWDVAQSVPVTADPDADAVNGTASFVVSSAGQTSQTVTATEHDDDANQQVITLSPTNPIVAAGAPVSLDVNYTTNPLDPTLTGLGLRIHYNSSLLTLNKRPWMIQPITTMTRRPISMSWSHGQT